MEASRQRKIAHDGRMRKKKKDCSYDSHTENIIFWTSVNSIDLQVDKFSKLDDCTINTAHNDKYVSTVNINQVNRLSNLEYNKNDDRSPCKVRTSVLKSAANGGKKQISQNDRNKEYNPQQD